MSSHQTNQTQTGNWADRLASGDRRSLAKALTAVESSAPQAHEIMRAVCHLTGRALVVGVTGAPGVGKSTLVNTCIREFRSQDLTVAVVAVDPSSVFSGGAILGDRVRMHEHSGDDGVFIRSVANRGQLGGLSYSTAQIIDVLDAAGRDVILVETVGVGQSEIEVANVAQVKVVVVQPDTGDGIQTMKAGVLEIADILVVNKSDLPHASRCVDELRQMTNLRAGDATPTSIIQVTALNGEGIVELVERIQAFHSESTDRQARVGRVRRLLITEACRRLHRNLSESVNAEARMELDKLSEQVQKADLTLDEAVEILLSNLRRSGDRKPGV